MVLFYFLIEFIGVTLVNKLYKFQVYNSVIPHMWIVLCVHHPWSSLLPSHGFIKKGYKERCLAYYLYLYLVLLNFLLILTQGYVYCFLERERKGERGETSMQERNIDWLSPIHA